MKLSPRSKSPFTKGPSGFSVGKNFSRVPFRGDLKAIAEVDRNHGLSFTVGALKSPFEKGDLGGFSTACEIPPDPPLPKGGTGKDGLQFDLSTHRVSQLGSRSAFDKRLQEVMQPGIRAPLIL